MPFRLLSQWGCDVVLRKGDIEIDLSEYDLEMPHSDALSRYAVRHSDLCMDFVTESVTRAGAPHLRFEQGVDKEEFLEYLKDTN